MKFWAFVLPFGTVILEFFTASFTLGFDTASLFMPLTFLLVGKLLLASPAKVSFCRLSICTGVLVLRQLLLGRGSECGDKLLVANVTRL